MRKIDLSDCAVNSIIPSVATDGAPTAPSMPAFGATLDDREVAAVITYIRNAWGNAAVPVSAEDVEKRRSSLAKGGE